MRAATAGSARYAEGKMIDSVLLYFGLAVAFAGLVSIALPLRFLRIRTRRTAMIVFVAGTLVAMVTLALPARERRVVRTTTELDRFTPVWQFDEQHTIHVDAPPELFDLEKDPDELKSVHDDPAYAEVRADLKKELDRLRALYEVPEDPEPSRKK